MSRKKKKVKLRIGRVLIVIVLVILSVFVTYKLIGMTGKIVFKKYFLASDKSMVKLYSFVDDTLKEEKEIPRGVEVSSNDKTIDIEDKKYIQIKYDDMEYFVSSFNVSETKDSSVLESERYVRTSSTIYKNEKDPYILSFVKKGNKVEILGYDYLKDDGNVNMYKIKYNDVEGYVYSKYLVDNETSALANYNENGVYDTHKDRKYGYELYGGKASTLDYYPYERVEFPNNPILKVAKSMYLNVGTISSIDSYLEIAKSSGVNAMVVDIKDGVLGYPVEVAKDYSKTAYDNAVNSFEDYRNAIKKIKDAGIYAIGRIVVFNDSHYGKDHPEDCITSPVSYQAWPSAYSRGAWEYNVMLAISAVKDMGFNEIQFDYVRFPETAYQMSKNSNTNFKNIYNEEKAEAVQNFLFYALDQIHKVEAYLSVDVFGECSSEYVTSYGQYWPAISNIVDAISSMPYTDHFGRNVDTWSNPYQTVYNWALGASARQKEIPTPAIARTWITAYDTPYWNPTVIYNAGKISDQAQALVDAGLDGGFITWHSGSNINKYRQIASAFSKDYTKNS